MIALEDPASAAGIDTTGPRWQVRHDDLAALLARCGASSVSTDALIAQVASALGADEAGFELRVGEWRLDLPAALARALVNATVLTGTLAALHEASVPAAVLSAVVPLVFDLQRVKLSASDRYLYAVLLRQAAHRRAIQGWYEHLPPHVRAELSALEFRDLIERLEDAGLADLDERDQLELDQPSDRRLVRLQLPPVR